MCAGLARQAGQGGPTEKDRLDLLHRAATGQREPDWPLWGKPQAALGDGHWRRAVETANAAQA